MDRKTITIDMPEKNNKRKKKINYELISQAKGIWKDKNINGVKYQRKLRKEWD